MMIDASTIIPIPRMRPLILILFTLIPAILMIISVMRTQIGMEREIIIVVLIPLKNTKMMRAARMTPSIREL